MKKKLSENDIIDIVAPSSACSKAEFAMAVEWLSQQGYFVRYPKDILKSKDYLAQTDQNRFRFLRMALLDSQSTVVWCLRGGYGAIRLLPDLNKIKKPKNEKYFIGLSDITVINHFLIHSWGWSPIHGPVLSRVASSKKRQKDYDELFDLLHQKISQVSFKKLKPINPAALKLKKGQKIRSKILGGNLTTFCSLLGTEICPTKIKEKNYFLFFEDIAERGYKVDRMLQQLRQAGVFKRCKGVFLGQFIQSEESNGKNLVPKTLKNFFEQEKFPVFQGIDSDHSEKQRPVILNSPAVFENNGNNCLVIKAERK